MAERYLKIVERVPDLPAAWAFIMGALDEVREPRVEIVPTWSSEDGFRQCFYDVVVSGTPVTEPEK